MNRYILRVGPLPDPDEDGLLTGELWAVSSFQPLDPIGHVQSVAFDGRTVEEVLLDFAPYMARRILAGDEFMIAYCQVLE